MSIPGSFAPRGKRNKLDSLTSRALSDTIRNYSVRRSTALRLRFGTYAALTTRSSAIYFRGKHKTVTKCCLICFRRLRTVVIARPGDAQCIRAERITAEKVIFVEAESEDVSSTKVREAILRGEPLNSMCHSAVVRYIEENGIGVPQ